MLEQEVRKAKEKNGEGENGKGNTDRAGSIDCRYDGAEAPSPLPVPGMWIYIQDAALRSRNAWERFNLSQMRWKTQKDEIYAYRTREEALGAERTVVVTYEQKLNNRNLKTFVNGIDKR